MSDLRQSLSRVCMSLNWSIVFRWRGMAIARYTTCLSGRSCGWNGPDNLDLLMRWFEMRLLECSGYMPELVHCVECREWLEPADHLFACDAGGVLCSELSVQPPGGALLPLPTEHDEDAALPAAGDAVRQM